MNRKAFQALVDEALEAIPASLRSRLENVAIVVEQEPEPELLEEMGIEPPDTLFGLYQGTPLTERGSAYGNTLPDRIVIYQKPIEEVSEDEDEIYTTIAETLIHEAGHYFGLSEEEIEEIEERYWRG
ncbi:MAG TPA: metallopeptidase family protein, partial [Vicinamibacterales bacterium]|nr:metallopeptidase family protein [Vicinamibacterales bacterium]